MFRFSLVVVFPEKLLNVLLSIPPILLNSPPVSTFIPPVISPMPVEATALRLDLVAFLFQVIDMLSKSFNTPFALDKRVPLAVREKFQRGLLAGGGLKRPARFHRAPAPPVPR